MNTKTKAIHKICPRCVANHIPNKTEICSACGTDEALKDHFDKGCEPVSKWPLSYQKIWQG